MGDIWGISFWIEGPPLPKPGEIPSAVYREVWPGYFETMQLPIVRGELVEFRQVDAQAQQPLQGGCHRGPNCGTDWLARHGDY